jgi:hypothetical protein
MDGAAHYPTVPARRRSRSTDRSKASETWSPPVLSCRARVLRRMRRLAQPLTAPICPPCGMGSSMNNRLARLKDELRERLDAIADPLTG